MTNKLALVVAGLALAVLAGCKMNLTADLYSTDLRDAKAGTADLTTPATMAFQVPGTDKCDEYTTKIKDIMEGVVREFAPKGCQKDGTDSFLLADIQISIVATEESWGATDALFGILVVEGRTNPNDIGVAIALDREKYRILLQQMKKEFHQTIDLAASKVILVLNNDDRGTIRFGVREVFLNADPVHGEKDFELIRRHKVEIRLSDVATAHLAKTGFSAGFVLKENSS